MANIASRVECDLVCNDRVSFGFGVFDDGHHIEQLWFLAFAGVAIAAGSDAGFLWVLGKQFGGQCRRAAGRPDGRVRRNSDKVVRRNRGVMALDAGDRAVGVVFAAVVLDVIETNAAELRVPSQRDNLRNSLLLCHRRRSRFRRRSALSPLSERHYADRTNHRQNPNKHHQPHDPIAHNAHKLSHANYTRDQPRNL